MSESIRYADRIYSVLFLCSANAARSIMAEAMLNSDGALKYRAYSAGVEPSGTVHPMALKELEKRGYSTKGLSSKNISEFSGPKAPDMDMIFTFCDRSHGEAMANWPGHPATSIWTVTDPTATHSSDKAKEEAFAHTCDMIKERISALVNN